jgi:hypothetical protein
LIAFLVSIFITVAMAGIVVWYAKRRPVDQPLTWGEAFVGGIYIFTLLLMIYGVVPDRWLRWADGDLKWRSDNIGIPTGPFIANGSLGFLKVVHHRLFPEGLTFFGRGKIIITAQVVRDILVSGIYVVTGLGQIFFWKFWQNRGKRAATVPAIETSAYGRPLVRRT